MTDPTSEPPGDAVRAQYEALPYPNRTPSDEAKRLIIGSPSHPIEIDHFLYGGRRDWRAPFRVLVAGGGTGDALIMIAQLLARRKTPADIHYLDLSAASRQVAEQRAAVRKLGNITFHTGDLLRAAEFGQFDYIDCCGVLHHLPDPEQGFVALAAALGPTGGLGAMVYAPLGRSGVYPLQAALAALTDGATTADKLAAARAVLGGLPPTHPFARNPLLGDHKTDDAGLFDLLLHARDTPFDVARLFGALAGAGLRLASWVEPARYAPETYVPDSDLRRRAAALDPQARAVLAEQLAGNIRAHRFYATRAEAPDAVARPNDTKLTPILHGVPAADLAASVAKTGRLVFNVDGLRLEHRIERRHARLLGCIDGRQRLDQIAAKLGWDWLEMSRVFGKFYLHLNGFNQIRFSHFLTPSGAPLFV